MPFFGSMSVPPFTTMSKDWLDCEDENSATVRSVNRKKIFFMASAV
jgi:hypothetical protein